MFFIDDLDIIDFIDFLTSMEPITLETNVYEQDFEKFKNISELIDWIEKNTSSDVNK